MAYLLKNKNIELLLELPLEEYNLARFDWTGKIREVKYKGRYLSTQEFADASPARHCGRGFYNEFGITQAVGFDEIQQGEYFQKIGIGALQKNNNAYQFHHPYPIQAATFECKTSADRVSIFCQPKATNGYSYELYKEIQLLESGFEVGYKLINTGEKPILTKEYNHNFLAIDRSSIGPDYTLAFAFPVQSDLFQQTVNPEEAVEFTQGKICFQSQPQNPFFFSDLSGGQEVEAFWKLENLTSKLGISETGSFKTKAINLWGWGHVISPELFIDVKIPAGTSQQWTRTYQIYELD